MKQSDKQGDISMKHYFNKGIEWKEVIIIYIL